MTLDWVAGEELSEKVTVKVGTEGQGQTKKEKGSSVADRACVMLEERSESPST